MAILPYYSIYFERKWHNLENETDRDKRFKFERNIKERDAYLCVNIGLRNIYTVFFFLFFSGCQILNKCKNKTKKPHSSFYYFHDQVHKTKT